MTLLGFPFYSYGLSTLFSIPFLLWLALRSGFYLNARRRGDAEALPRMKKKLKTAALVTLALLITLYLDVAVIAVQAKALCVQEGGLKIYRTVEAEGFAGDDTIEYWSKYGFRYAEGGFRDKIWRSEMIDGQPVRRRVNNYISRYGLLRDRKVVNKRMARVHRSIADLKTQEVLGEFTYF